MQQAITIIERKIGELEADLVTARRLHGMSIPGLDYAAVILIAKTKLSVLKEILEAMNEA